VGIEIGGGYRLSSVRERDREAHVRLLSSGEIAGWIPALPQPYTESIAGQWIQRRLDFVRANHEISFAIREPSGEMIGSVGVDDLKLAIAHNGELGYWLDPTVRGSGLATLAVRAFVPYAFDTLGLGRLTAHTLAHNVRSVRLLEKNDFALEGRLRRFTRRRPGSPTRWCSAACATTDVRGYSTLRRN
jgi:[ribosomal protein S5]-alanine N-acetyltransferase